MSAQPMEAKTGDLMFLDIKLSEEFPRSAFWKPMQLCGSKRLLNLDGNETILAKSWLKSEWTGTDAQLSENIIAEVLHYRPDWNRQTPHVLESQKNIETFLKSKKEGDRLFEFSSPQADWMSLAGRGGYVIMRGDTVISAYITRMS